MKEFLYSLGIFLSIIIIGTLANYLMIPLYVHWEFFKPVMLTAPFWDKIIVSAMFSYVPWMMFMVGLFIIVVVLGLVFRVLSDWS